jgi:hypothetical protein
VNPSRSTPLQIRDGEVIESPRFDSESISSSPRTQPHTPSSTSSRAYGHSNEPPPLSLDGVTGSYAVNYRNSQRNRKPQQHHIYNYDDVENDDEEEVEEEDGEYCEEDSEEDEEVLPYPIHFFCLQTPQRHQIRAVYIYRLFLRHTKSGDNG